jgi:23S rRNA (cytosine1962-C5)-methyltransferase
MSLDTTSPVRTTAGRVFLKPRKALPFFGRHPWVLASAVERVEPTSLASEHLLDLDGQVVDLLSDRGKFIARGIYNSRSRIQVRLFSWSYEEELDAAFWRRRIAAAINLRREIGFEPAIGTSPDERAATATRLIFSEADGLSGLTVDRYGDYLVVQATSLAVATRLEVIASSLQELLQPRGILLRTDKVTLQLEGMELADQLLAGELPAEAITIRENGLEYELDLSEGQKTGFYLDQRENRRAAAAYLRGRRVLDMFCYTGGFAMNAAGVGGAREVLGIDSSKKAVGHARANAARNQLANVRFDTGDGFKTLDALAAAGEKFDAVILDPPKFARSRSKVNQALMAYHRLNRSALDLLPPGGILVTCSCSGSVSREDFLLTLSGVAQKAGRDLQILEQRGAAADHPVSALCLETEYLKCFICRVS